MLPIVVCVCSPCLCRVLSVSTSTYADNERKNKRQLTWLVAFDSILCKHEALVWLSLWVILWDIVPHWQCCSIWTNQSGSLFCGPYFGSALSMQTHKWHGSVIWQHLAQILSFRPDTIQGQLMGHRVPVAGDVCFVPYFRVYASNSLFHILLCSVHAFTYVDTGLG